MTPGSNRVVLGPRAQGVAGGEGDEEEMADVNEEEAAGGDARDVTMAGIETTIKTATDTKIETETGALATNDQSERAQLRKVIQVDHCIVGDGSRT